MSKSILVGGLNPLKNMKVSWDYDSQYIYILGKIRNVLNHQPEYLLFGQFSPSSDVPNFAGEPDHPHIRRHVTFGRLLRNWGWLKWR
jgi:hypothetical protein